MQKTLRLHEFPYISSKLRETLVFLGPFCSNGWQWYFPSQNHITTRAQGNAKPSFYYRFVKP